MISQSGHIIKSKFNFFFARSILCFVYVHVEPHTLCPCPCGAELWRMIRMRVATIDKKDKTTDHGVSRLVSTICSQDAGDLQAEQLALRLCAWPKLIPLGEAFVHNLSRIAGLTVFVVESLRFATFFGISPL